MSLPAEPEPVAWDVLIDESIYEARALLLDARSKPLDDPTDAAYIAAQWMELGDLLIRRQHMELEFERWRDGHMDGGE